jgi:hypothetical protein
MQLKGKSLARKAGAMLVTTGLLAVSAWGQQPAPAPAPAPALPPGLPAGVQYAEEEPSGRIHGALRHAGRAIQAGAIGYPKYFDEPPVGYFINQHYTRMSANANTHRFMIYRSDFLPGTSAFSPIGASRFNLMASRLQKWQGPITIEWSPDEPGLAEQRRATVVAVFQRAKLPVTADRVVIGPTAYPGGLGSDAANNYSIMIQRDQRAPQQYSVSPSSASGFGAGGGGGGGGLGP